MAALDTPADAQRLLSPRALYQDVAERLRQQIFARQLPERMPKVMEVIPTEADTLDKVDAVAVARGIDAVESALRRWDAAAATP